MDTLGSGFKMEDLKDLTYVVVKAALRKKPESCVVGLLYGYRPLVEVNTQIVSQEEMFLWLVKGDDVHILNKFHYSISYIEVGKANSSSRYSSVTDEDNYKRIESLVKFMKENGKTEPSGLIDLAKYGTLPKDVEDEVKKPTFLSSQKSTTDTGTSHNRSGGQNYDWSGHHTNQYAYGYTPAKKEVSTAVIKRTTKYPISTAIDKMREKVALLRQGKYDPPKLKDIPGEKEESQKKAKSH